MSGYIVTWTSPSGITIDLTMGARSESGIWIKAIEGFTSSPEIATVQRSTGRGEKPTALSIPKMTGQLVLHIDPGLAEIPDMDVSDMWTYLESLFSLVSPGTMTVRDASGRPLSSDFYLSEPIAFPTGKSPHTPGIREIDMVVPLWSDSGGWWGETVTPSPINSTTGVLYNPGHLEEYISLELSAGGTVAQRLYRYTLNGVNYDTTLPSVTAKRTLSTNPGTGFSITDIDGNRDRAAQVALRGRYIPGVIAPGGYVNVTTGANVKATFTPYYLSPWR